MTFEIKVCNLWILQIPSLESYGGIFLSWQSVSMLIHVLRKKANLTMSEVKLPAATGEQKLSGLFSLGYGGQSTHALCTCTPRSFLPPLGRVINIESVCAHRQLSIS